MTERERLVRDLEAYFGKKVLDALKKEKNPTLELIIRTLSNAYFDEKSRLIRLGNKKEKRVFLSLGQAKKFMQTLLIAAQIRNNLRENQPAIGTRQLFYLLKHTIPGTNENTFDDQRKETDPIVEDIEVALDTLRENLGLFAVPDGYIVGPMIVRDRKTDDTLDYTKMGLGGGAIPAMVEDEYYQIKKVTAKFILVVEKYQVWQLLNQEKFWKTNNCLLMTGKGQSARAPRRLLARLSREFNLPIYVFTDLDPWGYYIHSVYKQGSINLAHFSEKAGVPSAKFLGLTTKDIEKYDIPKTNWIKLNKLDLKRIKELKKYPWFKSKGWQEELKRLEKFGYKVESDSLVAKKIEFTAKTYLPDKIKNKDFLA
jgi:DNA topoisomerase-6 subunit A